ncbi:2,3-dihydro-2,3-dihydroxybenzoate dehydrogenase [Oligoflexus tunisiensis]|uniref:2,3-dihydro-2,3-dihydroxybenzoate dehydrogenase n=1 Tax=Oligoflexus tunisiensis TaxID=708132 RepID=UPI000B07C483|nr:2,3-dihydro-2,3-dihydroxybenzoate dehydrogenase [Oligoflexus tunisiensis]
MNLEALRFDNKIVWVTGANQGIGQELARSFAALGARVLGFDRHVTQQDAGMEAIELDVSDADSVQRTLSRVLERDQRVDVIVNVAGVLALGSIEDLTTADWHHCWNVNASGPFYFLRAAIPYLKRQRAGAIVNVGSNASHVPRMKMAAYAASKAALVSLSQCAALELAPYGVRCNLVSPGSTDTAMQRSMWANADGRSQVISGSPEQFKLGIPLGKIAQPADIVPAIIFLASDLAHHITMQDIVIDGGATLGC